MRRHMGYEAAPRQESRENAALSPQSAGGRRNGSILLNLLSLLRCGRSPSFRCTMRSLFALVSCALFVAASSASAETRVFIIANQADGYGVDQCLAKGDKCGAQVARTYCQSRDFAQASAYRRVDPDEITGSVPKSGANCSHGHCDEYVAITCQR